MNRTTETAIMIAATEAKEEAIGCKTLTEQLRAAMNCTKDHWILTNEEDQFKAAIAAVMLLCPDDDKIRIETEIKQLNMLSAAMSGVPVDFGQMDEIKDPIGLLGMWKDVCGATNRKET